MAKTLGQLLKSSSGQLTESTDNTLNEALNKTDRPTAPLSPLAAAQIGTSADAAKMVGTKAQKTPALRQAVEGQDDLATFKRQETVKTTDQSEKIKQGQGLQTLSGLGNRVDQLVAANLKAQSEKAPTNLNVVDTTKGENPAVQAALTALNLALNTPAPEDDAAAIAQLNTAKGLNTVGAIPLTKQDILATYQADLGTQINKAVGTITNSTKVGDLWATADAQKITAELGLPSDAKSLAALIGKDEATLNGMTISELVTTVQGELAKEYSVVQNLEQQANDPFVGAAARAEARKGLRQAGAEGVRVIESDMDKLADDIADDMLIEIGGQNFSIDDALANKAVTDFLSNYLAATPDKKLEMQKDEPSLTAFADSHQTVLTENLKELEAAQTGYQGKIDTQNAQYDLGVGNTIGVGELAQLFPGIDAVGTDVKATLNASPLMFGILKGTTTEAERSHLTTYLKDIAKLPADNPIRRDLLATPIEELRKRGLTEPGPKWDEFQAELKLRDSVGQLSKDSTPDDLARVFGLDNFAALENLITEATLMEKSGLFGNMDLGLGKLKNFFVFDKNGKVVVSESINKMKGRWQQDMTTIGNITDKMSPLDVINSFGTYVSAHKDEFAGQQKTGTLYSIKKLIGGNKNISPAQFASEVAPYVNLDNVQDYLSGFKDISNKQAGYLADDLATESLSRHKMPGLKDGEDIAHFMDRLDREGISGEQVETLKSVLNNIKDASRSARSAGAGKLEAQLDSLTARLNKMTKTWVKSTKKKVETEFASKEVKDLTEISYGQIEDLSSASLQKQAVNNIFKNIASTYGADVDIESLQSKLITGDIPISAITDNDGVKKVYAPMLRELQNQISRANQSGASKTVAYLTDKMNTVNDIIQFTKSASNQTAKEVLKYQIGNLGVGPQSFTPKNLNPTEREKELAAKQGYYYEDDGTLTPFADNKIAEQTSPTIYDEEGNIIANAPPLSPEQQRAKAEDDAFFNSLPSARNTSSNDLLKYLNYWKSKFRDAMYTGQDNVAAGIKQNMLSYIDELYARRPEGNKDGLSIDEAFSVFISTDNQII